MLNKLIKEGFKMLGIDIKKYSIAQNQTARLKRILEVHNINLVFDIGANKGQFGVELRKLGYKNKIVSFEPILEAYNELVSISSQDSNWAVETRTAIGEIDSEIEINIAGNSASSSILRMLDSHTEAEPSSICKYKEVVPINKLDSLSHIYLNEEVKLFLKIDTQGYEDKVLNGASKTLNYVSVLQVELSLVELYSDQKLIQEMIDKITNMGFNLWGIEPAFINSENGRMLQVDAIFCK